MPDRDLRVTLLGEDQTGEAFASAADNAEEAGDDILSSFAEAGLAAGGAFGLSLMGAMDTQSAQAMLNAQLGASGQYAADLGTVAGNLYSSNYGESLGGVNDALRSVLQSGAVFEDVTNEQLQSITGQVMSLSTAMEQDVGGVSQAVGRMIQTGLATDAQQALDIITRGFQQGADRGGDLLDVIGEYGTTFQEVGLSGGDAVGLINQALAAGIPNADFAADAVREMGIIMREGGEDAATALGNLGLDANQVFADFQAGGPAAASAMDTVLDALRNTADDGLRTAAATSLIGTQYEDLGDAILSLDPSSAVASLGTIDGAAQQLDSTLGSTAAGNLEAMKRQVTQVFVDVIGGQVLPKITEFTGWIVSNRDTIQTWATVAASVVIPVLVLWGAAATVNAAKNVAAWVTTALASGTSATTQSLSAGQVVLAWVVAGAQSLIQGARMAAAWVLAMGPVGWVIAAVVGLVALIIANWDTVVSWTTTAWNAVTGALSAAWEWIKGVVASGAQWVMDRVAWFGELPGRVAGWFGGVKDAALGKLGELVAWVGGLPGQILSGLGNLGSLLLSAGRDLLSGLWQGIQNAKSWLMGKIGDFFGNLLPGWARDMLGIRSPSTVFAEMGRYLMEGMALGIDDGAGMAVDAVTDAANRVSAAGQLTASVSPSAVGAFGLAGAGGGGLGVGGLGATTSGGVMAELLDAVRDLRNRPTFGQIVTQDNETAGELADRLAFAARTGAAGG